MVYYLLGYKNFINARLLFWEFVSYINVLRKMLSQSFSLVNKILNFDDLIFFFKVNKNLRNFFKKSKF